MKKPEKDASKEELRIYIKWLEGKMEGYESDTPIARGYVIFRQKKEDFSRLIKDVELDVDMLKNKDDKTFDRTLSLFQKDFEMAEKLKKYEELTTPEKIKEIEKIMKEKDSGFMKGELSVEKFVESDD